MLKCAKFLLLLYPILVVLRNMQIGNVLKAFAIDSLYRVL